MSSQRFESLKRQVKALRKHFLPSRLSRTGYYQNPERVSTRALAFRLMCHAEVESYLEDRCVEVAKRALAHWKAGGYSATISCIALFSGQTFPVPPNTVHPAARDQKDWDDLVSPKQRIERAVTSYIQSVKKKNHGVREANLTALLIPIGLDLRNISHDLISRLDSFGQNRGEVAHQSANKFIVQGVDPADELNEVRKILKLLVSLDSALDDLVGSLVTAQLNVGCGERVDSASVH